MLQVVAAAAVLGAVGAVIWAKVVHKTRESPTAAIGRISGRSVSCTGLGMMNLTEGRSEVLLCVDSAGYRSCWADLGNAVADVTQEVRATPSLDPAGPRC